MTKPIVTESCGNCEHTKEVSYELLLELAEFKNATWWLTTDEWISGLADAYLETDCSLKDAIASMRSEWDVPAAVAERAVILAAARRHDARLKARELAASFRERAENVAKLDRVGTGSF